MLYFHNSFSVLFTHLKKVLIKKSREKKKLCEKILNGIPKKMESVACIHKYHTCNILQSICFDLSSCIFLPLHKYSI